MIMKFVIQRVTHASVTVEGKMIGKINKGFLVLIGVTHDDTKEIADKMVKKMTGLRIFEDEQGKTNLSLADVDGELLLVSQFTLYANCKRGYRPGFTDAGAPDMANAMYQYIISECKKVIPVVQTGEFGADMKVDLLNDGPFTTFWILKNYNAKLKETKKQMSIASCIVVHVLYKCVNTHKRWWSYENFKKT